MKFMGLNQSAQVLELLTRFHEYRTREEIEHLVWQSKAWSDISDEFTGLVDEIVECEGLNGDDAAREAVLRLSGLLEFAERWDHQRWSRSRTTAAHR